MMTRLAELDNGATFKIGGRDYIKLNDDDAAGLVVAINKSPMTSIDVTQINHSVSIGQMIFSSIMAIDEIKYHEQSEMVDVSAYAKYKRLIEPMFNDNWYIEWTNRVQGENGDYCYIDKYGEYCVGNENNTKGAPKDNILYIRQMYWFNRDTIVEI